MKQLALRAEKTMEQSPPLPPHLPQLLLVSLQSGEPSCGAASSVFHGAAMQMKAVLFTGVAGLLPPRRDSESNWRSPLPL